MAVRFLALDGMDGTGKSTQCRLLVEWLRSLGHPVTACVDPGGTALGNEIRRLLLDRSSRIGSWAEALLFMAGRAQLLEEVIEPALARGEMVVCDRWLSSTIAYQGFGNGLDPGVVEEIGLLAAGRRMPDRILLLDADPALLLARRKPTADRMEARDEAFRDRVRAGFRALLEREPARYVCIDAAPATEIVHQVIRRIVGDLL